MNRQQNTDFERIAVAIQFINQNFKTQPGLGEIAEKVNLSPFHFQRLFSEWAGVSPKKFLQYLTLEYSKKVLRENQHSLFQTALDSGLSGTSRLHDLFINIEGMTPGDYKIGGRDLRINYSFASTAFGQVIVASTAIGICHLSFAEQEPEAIEQLSLKFPNARFSRQGDDFQQQALEFFHAEKTGDQKLKLHLQGSPFQLKVWESLLRVPAGQLTTYGQVAAQIGAAGASRAVGTAVGANPVAFLIPCHRVIQSTGVFGHYHWGDARKSAMIGWEAARIDRTA